MEKPQIQNNLQYTIDKWQYEIDYMIKNRIEGYDDDLREALVDAMIFLDKAYLAAYPAKQEA